MEKIIEAFQGHIRVNEAMGDIELFDEHGVKMRLKVDAELKRPSLSRLE